MKLPEIQCLNGGRFTSRHEGAIVYYDSGHKVLNLTVEGGVSLLSSFSDVNRMAPAVTDF